MKLSDKEIMRVLAKIKEKYNKLITEFKKSKSILTSFEERYINVLKKREDISTFLLGEINAIDDYYDLEVEKKKKDDEKKAQEELISNEKSFADKIMDENEKKIEKYQRIILSENASQDIERLMGAVRELIVNYWPALTMIYKNETLHSIKNILNEFHHNLIIKIDYKDVPPIAKNYIYSLKKVPIDTKKIEYEYYYVLKESAFILNEILEFLIKILKENNIPNPGKKINFNTLEFSALFSEYFKNLTNKECFDKVLKYLENIILDFRVKDIKKNK